MSQCIPRDALAEVYCEGLSSTQGRPSKDARLVIGAATVMPMSPRSGSPEMASVDMDGEKLVLKRVVKPVRTVGDNGRSTGGGGGAEQESSNVPAYYGCMKGTVKPDHSFDLTKPADSDWEKV